MATRLNSVLVLVVAGMAADARTSYAQLAFNAREIVDQKQLIAVNVAFEPGGVTIRSGRTDVAPATYTYGDVSCKEYLRQEEERNLWDKNPLATVAGWVKWVRGTLGTPAMDHVVILHTRAQVVRRLVVDDGTAQSVLKTLATQGVADCTQVV